MHQKLAIGIVAAAVLIAGGWIWYQRANPTLTNEPLVEQFEWSFVDLGVNAERGIPVTDVSLRIAGVPLALGTYDGNCFSIAGSAWELMEDEISGAICYFAGGGKEIGVFEEGGKLVLKEGDVEEGSAEEQGFRGNFKPLTKQPAL